MMLTSLDASGSRSLPSMLAGGDLDGDVYLLLTEASGLVPSPDRIAEPAAYDAAPTVKLDREVSVEDGGEFFFKCKSIQPAFPSGPLLTTERLRNRHYARSYRTRRDPTAAPRGLVRRGPLSPGLPQACAASL